MVHFSQLTWGFQRPSELCRRKGRPCNRVRMAWGLVGLRMGTPTLDVWRKTCTTFICFAFFFNRKYGCFGFPRWLSGKEPLCPVQDTQV